MNGYVQVTTGTCRTLAGCLFATGLAVTGCGDPQHVREPNRFDFRRAGRITVDVIVEPPEAGWASATPVCLPLRP